MAQFGEIISRFFAGGGTRGLSGDAGLVLPSQPEFAFFSAGLRRHHTDEDMVAMPARVWEVVDDKPRKGGLRQHLSASRGDGQADFTDIMIIINSSDWARSKADVVEPWSQRLGRLLDQEAWRFCEEIGLRCASRERYPRFQIVEDGGPEMDGASLELDPGDFVTALLPNLYVAEDSPAVLALHLHIPGAWEGYREVGHLYEDQLVFTLGGHWLDNFSHPALKLPALYRLQRYPDGSFVHIINPDAQDRYHIIADEPDDGPSVVTIQDFAGEALAYLVLAQVGQAVDAVPAQQGGSHEPEAPPIESTTRTIMPAEVEERILTLREQGALLQKVHFSKFMEGYDVFIGHNGEVGTASTIPAATIQVRGDRVSLLAHVDDLNINGVPCPPELPIGLSGDSQITLGGQTLGYRDLSGIEADGWPYLAEIRRAGSTLHMVFGARHKVGRAADCEVQLPDEPHNDNIMWRPELEQGGVIRSRTGDIPKSRFYTDSIMVASQHAELDLFREPIVVCTARHCYTYIRRHGDIFSLFPTRARGGPTNMDLQPGDELFVGNSVFSVDYPPADRPRMLPTDPGMHGAPPPYVPPAPAKGVPTETDLPAAAGFGERGEAPPQPEISLQGTDSIVGEPFEPLLPPPAPPSPRLVEEHLADVPDPTALPERSPDSFRKTAPATLERSAPGQVRFVDEASWQFELSRPARIIQVGWMASGEVLVGNHEGAEIVIPENRSEAGQHFEPVDYARLFVRGRRIRGQLLSRSQAHLFEGDAPVDVSVDPESLRLRVIRRDADGEADFDVRVDLIQGVSLPDPRAGLLRLALDDQMVRGLFTQGLPLRASRALRLGRVQAQARYDGVRLQLTDYLSTYRLPDGSFLPLFVKTGGGTTRTAPEDGAAIWLDAGDEIISGVAIYRFER